MSMHKIPLTPLEEEGLRLHGLPAGVPNQRSDTFRQGMAWALKALASKHGICLDCGELYEHHYTEPFASCKCHCSEWHEMTPHMEAVKKAAEPTSAEYDLRKEDVPERLALCRMTDLIAKDPKMNREDELLPVQLPPARTRRIYIAGPMSGIEDHNFPAFNAQADILRKEGWTVLNPADHGVVEGAEWGDYLRHDLAGLVTCEAIYLLPGWESSKGARLEVTVAEQLGLKVLSAEPFEALDGSAEVVAWHYVDSWGSHVTEDFNEIQDSCGIEEYTALTPVRSRL